MTAISTTLSKREVRERLLGGHVIRVDAIADAIVRSNIITSHQNSGHYASRNVGHIVGQTAAIREATQITRVDDPGAI